MRYIVITFRRLLCRLWRYTNTCLDFRTGARLIHHFRNFIRLPPNPGLSPAGMLLISPLCGRNSTESRPLAYPFRWFKLSRLHSVSILFQNALGSLSFSLVGVSGLAFLRSDRTGVALGGLQIGLGMVTYMVSSDASFCLANGINWLIAPPAWLFHEHASPLLPFFLLPFLSNSIWHFSLYRRFTLRHRIPVAPLYFIRLRQFYVDHGYGHLLILLCFCFAFVWIISFSLISFCASRFVP